MKKLWNNSLKRMAALLMTLLMLVSQLVMPAAAMAMAMVDITMLPVVTVQYTDADGVQGSMDIYAAAGEDGAVFYWGQLPGNTDWSAGVYLTAMSMDGSYCLPDGSQAYTPMDATEVDGVSFTAYVEQYATPDDMPYASYPVYLSSAPMPEPEYSEPEPEPDP
ncbi:MAG: hypothetical protein IJ041_05340, partial [Clostridia bacterium]|nr:hypothetical protein [Clostridia bacterium]